MLVIFINMNYLKIHDDIIKRAKSENRIKGFDIYYESHHITPKCLGGSNKKNNLINLTAKEHWLIHLLLIEIYPDNIKLKLAIRKMMKKSNNQKRNVIISGDQYERLKKMISKAHGDLLRGKKRKPFTNEHKKNISLSMKGKPSHRKGKKCTEEQKIKIGLSSKGRNMGNKNHMKKPEFRKYMSENNPMYKKNIIEKFIGGSNPNAKKIKNTSTNIIYETINDCVADLKITRRDFVKMRENKLLLYV